MSDAVMETPQSSESDDKFLKYWEAVKENSSDFTSWTYLLQLVDQQNLVEKGREAYEEFFKLYPFCYGYWKKYADLEKKNGNTDLAKLVFQSGLKAIPLSVDLWIHYLNFMIELTKDEPDNADLIRKLFTEAVQAAGLEFRSDKLYDAYIEWEKSQGNLRNITQIYDCLLATPTYQYIKSFSRFKEHVNVNELCDILDPDEYLKLTKKDEFGAPASDSVEESAQLKKESDPSSEQAAPTAEETVPSAEETVPSGNGSIDEPMQADVGSMDDAAADGTSEAQEGKVEAQESMDETEPAKLTEEKKTETELNDEIRKKIIASREEIFKKNEEVVKKRWNFEDAIKRPYFHVKPLERVQLKNWREYLDFQMKEGSHKETCILFERCIIACAMYEEFWQKYISYLESRVGNEVEIDAVRVLYERACKVHVSKKPGIIMNWAAFEEKQDNVEQAREILDSLDERVPGLVMVKLRRAGLERRNGDVNKAVEMLKEEMEKTPSLDEKSFFAMKISKILIRFMDDKDSAKDIIYKALENHKGNKKLYLYLLDLELSYKELNEERLEQLCQLVHDCEELSADFKQGFFQRKLEILEDFGTDVGSVVESYETYQKQYNVKAIAVASKKRTLPESDAEQKAKISKADSGHSQANQADMNSYYGNASAYTSTAGATSSSAAAMAATSPYAYTSGMANAWGSYGTMQNAGAYYGWYNPYGAYSQQQTQ
eukprot:gene20193-22169_t